MLSEVEEIDQQYLRIYVYTYPIVALNIQSFDVELSLVIINQSLSMFITCKMFTIL